jgi:hypothetical protein
MTAALHKLSPRQWLLLLLLIPVVLLFLWKRVPGLLPDLPTRRLIGSEEKVLEKRREQLQSLQEQIDARQGQIAELKRLTASFWKIEDRNPSRQKGVIQNEVNRVLGKANIRGVDYQVINPRRLDLPDKSQVYEIEVTVNMTASMREIARVLAEVDRSPQTLSWSQCSLAPMNLRDTSKVRLTGTLKAQVLSPDAVDLLRGGSEVPP